MIALNAGSQDMRKALALGGTDEGAPGPRAGSFYGAISRSGWQ